MNTTIRPPASRLTTPLLVAAMLVGVGGLAYRSGANLASSAPNVAPIVATVNVEQIVNDCVETQTRNKANDDKYKADIDNLKKMEDQMTSINNEIKLLPAKDRSGRLDRLLKRNEIEGSYKAKTSFLQIAIDEEKSAVIRDVYTKVLATIDEYATKNNIALVLVDDTVLNVPDEGGMNAATSAIIQRRILFANKAQLDITSDILTKLNNDYAAGGASKPTGKATPKK